jgi:ribosome-associated protein
VSPDDIRVNRTCVIPAREVKFRFSRSSGPGGQNVNKRSTQVELIFDVANSPSLGPRQRARAMARLATRLDSDGRLRIVASEERTQGRNREIALERLRRVMSDALRPPPPKRRPTRPSARANARRISTKRRRGALKRTRADRPDDD